MTTPRRRWSFSLRTLFVVVTVLACWLGWQANVVRKRAEILRSAESEQEWWGGLTRRSQVEGDAEFVRFVNKCFGKVAQVSFVRRWMGDDAVIEIQFRECPPQGEIEKLRKWFPEARVEWCDMGDAVE